MDVIGGLPRYFVTGHELLNDHVCKRKGFRQPDEGQAYVTVAPYASVCVFLVPHAPETARRQLIQSAVDRLLSRNKRDGFAAGGTGDKVDGWVSIINNPLYVEVNQGFSSLAAFRDALASFGQRRTMICGILTLAAGSVCEPSRLSLLAGALHMVLYHMARHGSSPSAIVRMLRRVASDDDTATSMTSAASLASAILRANSLGPIVFATPELGKWCTVGGLGVMVDELSQGVQSQFGGPPPDPGRRPG